MFTINIIVQLLDLYITLLLDYVLFFLFFFFQAEDGIRDLTVTGVQTCALPISSVDRLGPGRLVQGGGQARRAVGNREHRGIGQELARELRLPACQRLRLAAQRSEERRVGEEWRSRWSPYHLKKKKKKKKIAKVR